MRSLRCGASIAEHAGGRPAAIIVEPIQGTAGNIVPPAGFLTACSDVAREHGALLIADEMITGFGRTGLMFGCNHDDVVPDIMTMGKGMASGFPVSAVLSTDEIVAAEPFSLPSASSSSYGGNPLAAAAALVTIQTIRDEQARRQRGPGRAACCWTACVGSRSRHPLDRERARARVCSIGFDLVGQSRSSRTRTASADRDGRFRLQADDCCRRTAVWSSSRNAWRTGSS